MNKSQVEYAERNAVNLFDEWNRCTGLFDFGTGYYEEMRAVVEDAVHVGIQAALFNTITFGPDGNIVRSLFRESNACPKE